jgi:hypothetical protein
LISVGSEVRIFPGPPNLRILRFWQTGSKPDFSGPAALSEGVSGDWLRVEVVVVALNSHGAVEWSKRAELILGIFENRRTKGVRAFSTGSLSGVARDSCVGR